VQDVCNDGRIFVDRDGEHFGHVFEYLRDGMVSVAEAGARPSVSLLRALEREFGFYCIELSAEEALAPAQPEMAFVMGGLNNNDGRGAALSSMERYDASSDQWSVATNMGTRRFSFGACAVLGEVYVSGGMDNNDNQLSSVEKYSPSSDTWSVVSSLPDPRVGHAAVAVGTAMYVLGGYDEVGGTLDATWNVLKLDSVQGIWSVLAPMPEPRYNFAACVVGSDIYVLGGMSNTRGGHDSVFKYDTETDEWSTLAPMPVAEFGHSISVIDGLVYVAGTGNTTRGLLRYDPASEGWDALAPLIHEYYFGVSFALDGCLYVAGGNGSESNVQRYDVTTNIWTEAADMLDGRGEFGAVAIGPTGPA
jgi:N-acetylneuraminic acid mutarotase